METDTDRSDFSAVKCLTAEESNQSSVLDSCQEQVVSNNANGWIKLMRSPVVYELLRNKNAFILLTIIALRARRSDSGDLKAGEALIGDYANYGLSRGEYRSAKNSLQKNRLAAFKATSKGTIATLIEKDIYDINAEPQQPSTQPSNNHQNNHQITTNKNEKNDNKKERILLMSSSRKNHNGNRKIYRVDTEYRQSEQYPECLSI